MKKFKLSLLASLTAIALVSYTNAASQSNKFACTWFLYDDPTTPGWVCDYPTTAAQAKNPMNYRPLTAGENINVLCPSTVVLCAICVERAQFINGILRPIITGDPVEAKINAYFMSNNPAIIDYPGFIAEKEIC